jgi:hypothetical protein
MGASRPSLWGLLASIALAGLFFGCQTRGDWMLAEVEDPASGDGIEASGARFDWLYRYADGKRFGPCLVASLEDADQSAPGNFATFIDTGFSGGVVWVPGPNSRKLFRGTEQPAVRVSIGSFPVAFEVTDHPRSGAFNKVPADIVLGSLSLAVLSRVTFDFRARVVYFGVKIIDETGERVRVIPWVDCAGSDVKVDLEPVIAATINGESGLFTVDTGGGGDVLIVGGRHKPPFASRPSEQPAEIARLGVAGLPAWDVEVQTGNPAGWPDSQKSEVAGLIGSGWLRRFDAVCFDWDRRCLIIVLPEGEAGPDDGTQAANGSLCADANDHHTLPPHP